MEELQCLEGHEDRVWSLAWSPSGNLLASCSGDLTVRIWARTNPDDGGWHCTAVLDGHHTRTVRSCSWSPCGSMLATASFDRTVAIWEVDPYGVECQTVAVLEGHENEVKAVAWNPNGNLIATCGRDKTVWVWESAPGHEYEVVDVKHGHSQDVKTVVWHPKGELLASASYDDAIKIWMECDDEWICVQTLGGDPTTGHSSTVWDVAFDRSGDWIASCSDDCTVRIWQQAKQTEGGTSEPRYIMAAVISGYHERTIFSVDWSPDDDLIATGCADNSIRVLSVRRAGGEGIVECSLECCREHAHVSDVNCVRWHPTDAQLLASAGDDGCVRLWRFRSDV